ncbi:MAG: hypothetical protein R3E50_01725 [Halioglobus sp.]
MENNYAGLLDAVIEKHNLRASWREGLFDVPEETKQRREEVRYKRAKRAFGGMMLSSKNDGSQRYLSWAIGKALGISPTKASYRKALDGPIKDP